MKQAIIHAGSARFVGNVIDTAKPGTVVVVHDAFEIMTNVVMVPTPEGKIGFGPATAAVLIDGTDRFIDFEVFATAIRFEDTMGRRERDLLAEARRLKEEESKQLRAQNAGIHLSSEMPKGEK